MGVYAIGDLSFCAAFAVGPVLAGPIVKAGERKRSGGGVIQGGVMGMVVWRVEGVGICSGNGGRP